MTRPVDTASPRALPGAVKARASRARLGTDRSQAAPVPFEPAPSRRALLAGLLATATVPVLPAQRVPSPSRVALGSTPSRVTAEGDAWLAYRRALLRQICDALQIDLDTLLRDDGTATAAALRGRLAAVYPQSPIAPAEARQGLPTAIKSGAAS